VEGSEAAPASEHRPVVVYIAGSGRSGSTLLERMLGAAPGMVNIGELVDAFRRVVPGDERCGCGDRFSACPFWCKVGERAFGGWHDDVVAEFQSLQRQVDRQRHMPKVLVPKLAPEGFTRAVLRYGEL